MTFPWIFKSFLNFPGHPQNFLTFPDLKKISFSKYFSLTVATLLDTSMQWKSGHATWQASQVTANMCRHEALTRFILEKALVLPASRVVFPEEDLFATTTTSIRTGTDAWCRVCMAKVTYHWATRRHRYKNLNITTDFCKSLYSEPSL